MQSEKDRLVARYERWKAVRLWTALGAGAYLLVLIVVLSQWPSPVPSGVGVLFFPLIALIVTTTVARRLASRANQAATVASMRGAADSVSALADEIEDYRRRTRRSES